MNYQCANFVISFFADSEGRIGPVSGTPAMCPQTTVLARLGPSWRQLARMAEKRVCMKNTSISIFCFVSNVIFRELKALEVALVAL